MSLDRSRYSCGIPNRTHGNFVFYFAYSIGQRETRTWSEPKILVVTTPLILTTLSMGYYVRLGVALAAEHDFLVQFFLASAQQ